MLFHLEVFSTIFLLVNVSHLRSDQAKFESLIRQLTALHQAPAAQLPAEEPRELTQESGTDQRLSQEMSDQDIETSQEAQKGEDMGQKIAKGIEIGMVPPINVIY